MARSLLAAAIILSFSATSRGFELAPGRIRNPDGLQLFQRMIYNPVLDDYLLLYEDGRALVGHLSPTGVFSGETVISTDIGVTHVNAAFNPDDGTFLLLYRDGDPPEIYGRYLTSDGTPIGNAFFIGNGFGPNVAFSPVSGRYLVTWEQGSTGTVRYRVIDGDSTSPAPNLTPATLLSTGLSDGVAYGSVADKFLVTYVREAGTEKGNVYGRFITSNGLSVGPELPLVTGAKDQGSPRVGYAPSTNRWMVVYEGWANCGTGCPHIRGLLVSATGAVVETFTVATTPGWDQPGPVIYNPVTDTFITGWRSATNNSVEARAGEFSPLTGDLVGPTVLLSDLDTGVEAVAARPDPTEPQATFLWRFLNGGDGIHAGIINLTPPLPDTTPPDDVSDLSGEPVAGGLPIPATAIGSTSPGPSTTDMTKTTDGDPATYWQSPSRAAITPEFITWDLGAAKTLSQVSLLARTTGNLFPLDYQIQVSPDNVNFTTVFSVTAAAPALGAWVDHALPDPTARYVRLWITKTKKSASGKYIAQIADVEIREATPGATLSLHWTAPGDDGASGTATSYNLRWSSSPINDGNFNAASAIATSHPLISGNTENVAVAGFPSEDIVYFALKTSDEVPNVSGLSNVLQLTTPGVAPAPVLGLTASNPTGISVHLQWQPSGDDGNTGNATSYDIRYSTSPINDANFDAAAFVIRPATNPKPAFESYTLGDLANQTTYYLAIKALDDVGLASAMNGGSPVTTTTLDVIAPSTISDLALQTGGGTATKMNAPAIAASGESSASVGIGKATDANLSSYWSTPGRATQQNEFITLDAGTVRRIGRVRLRSPGTGALFPEDLEIQLSNNNSTWVTEDDATGLPATKGIWHDFDFGPVNARYVRIFITKTRLSGGGLYYAQIAEIEAYEFPLNHEVTVTWTEPGDDGGVGTAAFFDLRYATSSIDNDTEFNNANPIVGEPIPQGAGSLASFTSDVPEEGVTLYFRMKSFDDAGNPSPLSNSLNTTTVIIPPAPVSDLLAFNATSVSADISWTSTGDDGGAGTATSFDVRYATSPITAGNFGSATPVSGEPVPAVAGTPQGMTVGGLSPSTTYYFAMRVHDETPTPSAISNVVSATTDAPDSTAPAAVADLAGSAPFTVDLVPAPGIAASSVESASAGFAKATDGITTSYWGSLGKPAPAVEFITVDTGANRSIGQVQLLSRPSGALFPEDLQIQVSTDNAIFTTVHTAIGLSAAKGMLHTFTFPATTGRYVRVNVTKPRISGGGLYAAQIAEIQVFEANFLPGPVTLQWTAPGDDGVTGTATSYDLRRSNSPITLGNFGSATPVGGVPSPQAAGSLETFDVNLPTGTYFFAIRTKDEVNNQSGLSNVPVIVVP
jgi:hypothetical protein